MVSEYLETDVMLPAAGQGSLAIECRTADAPAKPGPGGVLAQAEQEVDQAAQRIRAEAAPRSRVLEVDLATF